MNSANRLLQVFIALTLIAGTTGSPHALAEWQANPDDKRQVKAQAAIERIKEKAPESQHYFDQAYGYAILYSVTRAAIGFGGAYGRGLVIEGDTLIGKTGFWQFTSGLQLGVNNVSLIVFFKDKEALEYFKTREMQFSGQAGLSIATFGISEMPSYNEGVALLAVTRLGLMAEAAYGGIKFTYKDLPPE